MSANNPAIVIGVSAVDTSSGILQGVDDKIKQTTQTITNEADKITAKTTSLAQKFRENAGTIATTAAGLGAGIVGFATSFSTLEKAQTRSDQAQLTYERSLSRLNDMVAKGTYSADELAQQQEKVRINADKAKQSQDDLNDTYTNFLANIPSQLMSFGVSANAIYSMLKVQQTTTAATSEAASITYTGALTSMNVANAVTTESTLTLGSVMRTVFLSNPYLLPILAIGTVIAAVAFNVGGLRDRINELGKAIGDALPFLRPLLDAIGSLQDFLGGSTKKTDELTASTYDLGDATESVGKKIQTYTGYLADNAHKAEETAQQNLYYIQSTGAVKDALNLTNEQLQFTADYLKRQADDAEQAKQDNFNLVASYLGINETLGLSNERLTQYANALKVAKEKQDDIKPAIDATSDALAKQKTQIDTVKSALDALAESQQRTVITMFGQQVGLSGTVSTDALTAAGFGGNSDLMASAASGRLGGVFTPSGRVLDTGGMLYEDVIGVGKETGTPHYLHKNELVVPPSKAGGGVSAGRGAGGPPVHIHVHVGSEEIASAIVDDITRLQGKQVRLQAKTYGQKFGTQR